MVLREPARHAREHRLVVETAVALQATRDSLESPRIVGDRVAESVELRPRRHPQPRPDHRLAGLEMEIEPGAARVGLTPDPRRRSAVMEPARRVRLVGGLVLREANVAIDAEHRPLRVADHLRRELRKAYIHLADEVAHRLADLALVLGAMRLEPRLVVVLREAAEEPQRCRCEWHRWGGCRAGGYLVLIHVTRARRTRA